MEPESSVNSFSPDRPINSKTEDLLERASFAESLAKAIKSWKGKDSLVIALYGPWGSGKSSIKNLVLEYLRSSSLDCPSILEFNPWQLASQSQITEAFFNEVGTALGRLDTSANAKRLSTKFHAYGRYISTGRFVFVGIKRFLIAVLAGIGVLGLVGAFFEWYLFLVALALGIMVMAASLRWFSNLCESISESFQAEARASAETIPEIKSEISGMLASLPRPVLVVLDDVDRLSGDELKLLFQLLKGNADFPNIIYLLLLSWEHAEKNLESLGGKEYLEKIIQVGFEMPSLQHSQVGQVLGHEIEKIMSSHGVLHAFTSEIDRWRTIYSLGAHVYFRTIRDVRRFASVLDFQLSHFSGASTAEINVVDLTALQVLAVFESKLYHAIYSAKERVVGVDLFSRPAKDNDKVALIDQLLSLTSNDSKEYARGILTQLFPRLLHNQLFNDRGDNSDTSFIQSLRVCHAGFFDRYFLLTIPQHDLSESELKAIIESSHNREKFISELSLAVRRDLFDVLFERLDAHVGKFDMDQVVSILTSLFDFGDMMPRVDTSFYIAIPEERIAQLASSLLSRESDAKRQHQILIESMRTASGIYAPLLIYTRFFRTSGRGSSPDLKEFRKAVEDECLVKIRRASEDGTLKLHKNLVHILRYWNGIGGPESGVRPWVSELIQDKEGLIKFLREMSSKIISSDKGRLLRTNVESVVDFVPIEELEKRIHSLMDQPIRAEDKVLLNAWDQGISYRKSASSQEGRGCEVDF